MGVCGYSDGYSDSDDYRGERGFLRVREITAGQAECMTARPRQSDSMREEAQKVVVAERMRPMRQAVRLSPGITEGVHPVQG